MPQGTFQSIELKPGINKNTTSYGNESGWIDADKVRFKDNKPRKIGGWNKQYQEQFTGVARAIISWTDLTSDKFLALGTNKKVIMNYGGVYYDITPVRVSSSGSNILSTTNGSASVNVYIVGHNCVEGDYFRITNTPTIGGITLGGEYTITSIVDTNNFTITASSSATSTVTSGGGTCTYKLMLQSGLEYNKIARGWGSGKWNTSTWDTARTATGLISELSQWSFDTWGEDLIACPRGGRIYVWDRTGTVTTPLTLISNSPTQNNFTFVSYPTRHMVSLGCTSEAGVFDPMLVRWSSSEDYTDWVVTPANSAGNQRMMHGNKLMGAEPSKREVLVFTDEAVYAMNYLGAPLFFGFDLLGTGAGLISQNAAANINGTVYWMSKGAFYRYDGSLRTLNCTVRDAIFNVNNSIGLNFDQKQMVFAGVNQEFNEIIWLYPSNGSTTCNRYVIYNYLEDTWYDGTIDRSTWEDSKIFSKPFATSNDSYLYVHEQGTDADGNPMYAFISSAMFDIGEGDNAMMINKFVPDFEQTGNLQLTLTSKKFPQSTESVSKTYILAPTSGMINVRARGRQAAITIASNTNQGNFKIGKPRISIIADGER